MLVVPQMLKYFHILCVRLQILIHKLTGRELTWERAMGERECVWVCERECECECEQEREGRRNWAKMEKPTWKNWNLKQMPLSHFQPRTIYVSRLWLSGKWPRPLTLSLDWFFWIALNSNKLQFAAPVEASRKRLRLASSHLNDGKATPIF